MNLSQQAHLLEGIGSRTLILLHPGNYDVARIYARHLIVFVGEDEVAAEEIRVAAVCNGQYLLLVVRH